MFATDDTIVAIATPPGRGGLGVVRISGPASQAIAATLLDRDRPLAPRHATLARVRGLDEVIATLFALPHSYTGQDVVEISTHGSPAVLQTIVRSAVESGARLAEPGEFTLRAFLNGRLDLIQSEAVADLIDAATPLQARTAFDQLEGTLTRRIGAIEDSLFDLTARLEASLDFPDEGYHFIEPAALAGEIGRIRGDVAALVCDARRGRLIREGAQVAIVGRTNVGKSSIFNRLAGGDRAIVTATPGTTRDLVTERVDLNGMLLTLVDTAGLRDASDAIETEGISRAKHAARMADLVVAVFDGAEPLASNDEAVLEETRECRRRVIVVNKSDRGRAAPRPVAGSGPEIEVSALTGAGMDELRAAIVDALAGEVLRDTPAISNVRHAVLLRQAEEALERAERAAGPGAAMPEEFVLADLHSARVALEEVTGKRTSEDLLQHIFERFCIGK
jgi:tRNA modification GTPase